MSRLKNLSKVEDQNYLSHEVRSSDSSSMDEVCERCGAHDSLGSWGKLIKPCPKETDEHKTKRLGANAVQHGGDHYKTGGDEHWDVVEDQGMGYLEGCATKYVARFRDKGGRLDLEKAGHYVQKLKEIHLARGRMNRATNVDLLRTDAWLKASQCNVRQGRIVIFLLKWTSVVDLDMAASDIARLIQLEYPA